ncbi:hypothetical protein RSOLAG1IB_09633 [Rhizoctonia solani AG-1 IB]|uniref:Pkinase domain-containing protein n=1 Tax=Thanatephorus cucumeris (strain AG1-IB / isolate 7/3/14) TaxID=1108050 RepID=A0A0B7FW57_THACB|nr:hypothetical protein RSOLAG1IB_09633 [Rhizoctonia solani AG-1 IB]
MTFLETITGAVPYAKQCRADINIYHALTKKVFPRKDVEIFGSHQRGEGMWTLLMRCWDHDPTIRPTAREVLVALQALIRET